MSGCLTIWRLHCLQVFLFILTLIACVDSHGQAVKYFKVKNNTMYVVLSRGLSPLSVDSFAMKYNILDIGLTRFFRDGKDDSLFLTGWKIDRSQPEIFVITKPLERAGNIPKEGDKSIFSAIPTPEDWRVVGGNRVVYGVNSFKNNQEFKTENNIVHFTLNGFENAGRVRLAGNFTNWQHGAFPMTRKGNAWTVNVKLMPGKYYYKFIVDENRWFTDPWNNLSENDGRGNENSVYYVTNKTFELKGYNDAKNVFVAGSFNNWAEHKLPLRKTAEGWRADIYLEPGTHTYKFLVDDVAVKPGKDDISMMAIGKPYEFSLKGYEDAKKVALAGNFNDWNENELLLKKMADEWKTSYVLGPGNYQYKFIVDGNWITDPQNPMIVNDGKGNKNSFLVIGPNYTFKLKGFGNARKVLLAGDFNNWSNEGLPMKKVKNEWLCAVYLGRGKHLYKFIVDGKWILDPGNKAWEENEFGTGNSVLWVEGNN